LAAASAHAQTTFTSTFRDTTAPGWVFGGTGSTDPYLTAGVVAGDTAGNGWLRLTENTNNQSTFALLDDQIFSVNAQIDITMEYASWNGSGADGITFFLVDGSIDSNTFSPGAYGGSMGYAQRTGVAGMPGGYLGFALDDFGNFSNNAEGRNGGVAGPGVGGVSGTPTDSTLRPNTIAVRGPESSNYEFIAASANLSTLPGGGQIDFPSATTRPDQTGADFRAFHITLDANNLLTVQMQFGAASGFTTLFTADLSAYDRPEYFKLGFTGATGGSTEIHEVRNLEVTTTPWQSGPTSFEWDNGGGTSSSATATNWVGDVALGTNGDLLFGNKPSSGPQTVTFNSNITERSLTFDSPYFYTLDGTGTITLGNTSLTGLPSINVNDYNGAQGDHKINNAIVLAEDLRINNYSYSTLCLNGGIDMGANDITVNGHGAVNFNSTLTGSGDLIKNGSGITTIGADNFSTFTGAVTINNGLVVITSDGALGSTGSGTTVNNGGTLAFRGGVAYTRAEPVTISGNGVMRGTGQYAGAIYNDGGDNSFAGNITMAANSGIGSRDGTLTLDGTISGAYNLTKLGAGVVELTNSGNSYSGATIIQDGVLRVTAETALPGGFATGGASGGNLQLAGGVLEIGTATAFTRRLGTAADQVQFTGDGGFSAYGAARTVTLTNSAGTANGTLTWNAGSFVPTGNALLISSAYADNTVTLTNAIDLGSAQREVRVANGSAAVDGILSGALSNGGLVKTGAGTLELSGSNTYAGATEIQGGALRFNGTTGISTNSNFVINGGVIEFNMDVGATLGTGANQLRWAGSGGLSAYGGADRTVTFDGGAGLTWNTGNFVATGQSLVFGSTSATNAVILANDIDLGTSDTRTIKTIRGTSTTVASGTLSGVVSGAANLAVTGNGRLDLTATNTNSGLVTIAGSEVRLSGASGTMASVVDSGGTAGFTIQQGGRLYLDNSSSSVNRIGDTTDIAMNGGRLDLIGRTSGTGTTETVGVLSLTGGENQINVQRSGSNATILAFDSLSRTTGSGSTLEFTNDTGGGTLGSTGNNPRVTFTSSPTLERNILPYAVWGDGTTPTRFATISSGRVTGNAGTNTAETSWTASTIAAPTGGTDRDLSGDRTVGALSLGSGVNITETGARTLTIDTGGILSTGATASTISVSTLNVGGTGDRELFTHVYGGGLTISSSIQDNGNTTGLVKSGNGTLTLSGTTANTNTGATYVNDGTLVLAKSAGTTALAGNITVGDGRGTDVLQINANEQIADIANVTLRGNNYGNGETKLSFGGTTSGITETFASLTIEGAAVVDFAGGTVCSPNYLYLSALNIPSDGTLLIRNWIEFTDFILIDSSINIESLLPRIQFEGYPDQAFVSVYDSGWNQIRPVPEPSTYGLMMLGGGLAFYGFRRWRQNRSNKISA
jgi:autotransporter-associated beta strand protein